MSKLNLFVSVSSPGSVPSLYRQYSGVIRITSINCSGYQYNVTQYYLSMESSHHQTIGMTNIREHSVATIENIFHILQLWIYETDWLQYGTGGES